MSVTAKSNQPRVCDGDCDWRRRSRGTGTGSPPISLTVRTACVAVAATTTLVVLLMALAVPSSASAATKDEVFAALKLDSVPADYVVLVDNSGSMRVSGLYARVRAALAPFVEALSPQDHVSLITFAGAPALRFTGSRGPDPTKVLAQLPMQAYGKPGTDIGAALNAALSELERPDASEVGTVLLITDGKHTPPAGSAYPSTSGPTWNALGRRGQDISARHNIGAYALALTDQSDADLLKRAFSGAQLVALPRNQLRPYLVRVKEETRIATARRLVSVDNGKAIQVAWPDIVRHLDLTQGAATVEITLHSRLGRVPVTLSQLAVIATGLPITGTLPGSLTLGPGETKTIKVRLSFSHLASDFRLGQRTITKSGSLRLAARLGSPWTAVLTNDLTTTVAPTLANASTPTRATAKVGLALSTVILLILLVVTVVAGCFALLSRRRSATNPRMTGSLDVSGSDGSQLLDLSILGRQAKVGPSADVVIGIMTGRLRGRARESDGIVGPAVEVDLRSGDQRTKVVLADGESVMIGDQSLTFGS